MKKWGMLLMMAILFTSVPRDVHAMDEFEYLTKCVQAEAGNQDEHGKRLVAAVILNRVNDDRFPDNIVDVINAPHQFSVVSNGMIKRVDVDNETIVACQMEMIERTDIEIIYFNNSKNVSGRYCYKYGDHYFAK